MKNSTPTLRDALLAAGLAAGGAVSMALLLASVGTPGETTERLAAAESRVTQAERLFRPGRNPTAFGPDAICARPPEEQAAKLRETLAGFANQGGIEITGVDARPLAAEGDRTQLVPVRLRFEATGSYDAVILLLDLLGRQRPEVFVDAVDLTSRTSNVTLAFTGRVFCSV